MCHIQSVQVGLGLSPTFSVTYLASHPGASIPLMHLPSVSDFPPIAENLSDSMVNNFPISHFPQQFLGFHQPKYLMTNFLVTD